MRALRTLGGCGTSFAIAKDAKFILIHKFVWAEEAKGGENVTLCESFIANLTKINFETR